MTAILVRTPTQVNAKPTPGSLGGGWSDCVIECLRPEHRDLRDSLENIASAGDVFATLRQRALARQALGLTGTSEASRSGIDEADEVDLLEALADGL